MTFAQIGIIGFDGHIEIEALRLYGSLGTSRQPQTASSAQTAGLLKVSSSTTGRRNSRRDGSPNFTISDTPISSLEMSTKAGQRPSF